MKKKLLTFSLLLVSIFVFSCAEEVLPIEQALEEPTESIVVDDQKSTDGEEEPEEEVGNFPKN